MTPTTKTRRATETLRRLGVRTFTHGEVHGLVRDPAHPTGYRLAGTAPTAEALARKLRKRGPAAAATPTNLVQCAVTFRDRPVTRKARADEAARLANPGAPYAEAAYAVGGVWLLNLRRADWIRLEAAGTLTLRLGEKYRVEAEMP